MNPIGRDGCGRSCFEAQVKEKSMEARLVRAAILVASLGCLGASYRTQNFVVQAATDEIAHRVGDTAEKFRHDLAIEWLGQPMLNWSQPCPITVQVADNLGAGGATSFVFNQGEVFGWQMNIQGSLERVLDSVLPHEVTHTIFASHFRQPLPRWADEGGSTTVEHASERVKQQHMLISFLRTGRGIPFSQMFAMKDYPRDILPLYAQGHSLASFLMAQGGKQKFLSYLREGMETEQWVEVTTRHYGYANLAVLQNTWLDWVRRGSPALPAAADATNLVARQDRPRPASGLIVRGQSPDGPTTAQPVVPIQGRAAQQAAAAPAPAPAPAEPVVVASSGWYPAGKRPPAAALAAQRVPAPAETPTARPEGLGTQPTPTASTAAKPRPRQPILEWSRAENGDRSVYDTSSVPPQTVLR
jgi:hypothetical protein